jgi:hypothetical protein
MHPEASEYVIVTVPDDIPFTMPLAEPTVATALLLLLHVPPASVLERVAVGPSQTVLAPVIAAGVPVTVTVCIAGQPAPTV